jgi:hypothetical protein
MYMKFAISSHKDYFEKTHEIILNSLIEVGIKKEDIFFFIGGYEKKNHNQLICESPIIYTTSNNYFELTALVTIMEMNLVEPWWFLLHDTCYVGPNFLNRINEINREGLNTIRLHEIHDSMNMGAYSWDFLMKNKEFFLNFLNEHERDGLQRLKRVLIHNEDFLLNLDSNFIGYSKEYRDESDTIDFYGTQTDRKICHFPGIDIYKIQANWIMIPEETPYVLNL